jgi:RNA polymerase sigma-54 factor
MKQTLQLRLGQQLTMTPQLQQAIRLLQLSTLELQTEIQEALESNPMLEVEEESSEAAEEDTRRNNEEAVEAQTAEDAAGSEATEPDSTADLDTEFASTEDNFPDELPVDSAWEDIYEPSYSAGERRSDDSDRDFLDFQSDVSDTSLRDRLVEQLRLLPISEQDQAIGAVIIDAVDDNGYLSESLEDILEGPLANGHSHDDADLLELDQVEAVLHMIQQFDPPGVAARDPGESMAVQLQHLPKNTPGLDIARTIVCEHLDTLAARDFNRLRRNLKITDEELQTAISLIQSLNPRPGSQIDSKRIQYIVPDVFVRKHKGVWRVELNPDIAPRLSINSLYSSMVRRADKSDDNNFLRNHLQEARWFIKSLQSRNETLLKVATSIVKRQRGFLEYGEEAMKPMVLRDIAEQLEMHESTISRVTTQKFMHTPRGIFEFKYFFSSHVGTADGGECSATAIRAMVRKLIAEENRAKPLSDNKIASILVEKGINVARRTVAKYREAMAIPPSNERKRLA